MPFWSEAATRVERLSWGKYGSVGPAVHPPPTTAAERGEVSASRRQRTRSSRRPSPAPVACSPGVAPSRPRRCASLAEIEHAAGRPLLETTNTVTQCASAGERRPSRARAAPEPLPVAEPCTLFPSDRTRAADGGSLLADCVVLGSPAQSAAVVTLTPQRGDTRGEVGRSPPAVHSRPSQAGCCNRGTATLVTANTKSPQSTSLSRDNEMPVRMAVWC